MYNDEGIENQENDDVANVTDEAKPVIKLMVNAVALRDFVKALHLADEVKLKVSDNGVKVLVVDPSHVCMAKVDLAPEMFELLSIEETREIGINVDELKDILKLAKTTKKDPDTVTIEMTHKGTYQVGYHDGEFSLVDLEGFPNPKPPTIPFVNEFKVRVKELYDFLRKADNVSDHIEITVATDEVMFVAHGEKGKARLKLPVGSNALPELEGQSSRTLFSMEYFMNMVKAIKGSSEYAVFKNATNYPLEMTYTVQDGRGKVMFMLAPRLEND